MSQCLWIRMYWNENSLSRKGPLSLPIDIRESSVLQFVPGSSDPRGGNKYKNEIRAKARQITVPQITSTSKETWKTWSAKQKNSDPSRCECHLEMKVKVKKVDKTPILFNRNEHPGISRYILHSIQQLIQFC